MCAADSASNVTATDCVCVCERERESVCGVCVCMCVCVREDVSFAFDRRSHCVCSGWECIISVYSSPGV